MCTFAVEVLRRLAAPVPAVPFRIEAYSTDGANVAQCLERAVPGLVSDLPLNVRCLPPEASAVRYSVPFPHVEPMGPCGPSARHVSDYRRSMRGESMAVTAHCHFHHSQQSASDTGAIGAGSEQRQQQQQDDDADAGAGHDNSHDSSRGRMPPRLSSRSGMRPAAPAEANQIAFRDYVSDGTERGADDGDVADFAAGTQQRHRPELIPRLMVFPTGTVSDPLGRSIHRGHGGAASGNGYIPGRGEGLENLHHPIAGGGGGSSSSSGWMRAPAATPAMVGGGRASLGHEQAASMHPTAAYGHGHSQPLQQRDRSSIGGAPVDEAAPAHDAAVAPPPQQNSVEIDAQQQDIEDDRHCTLGDVTRLRYHYGTIGQVAAETHAATVMQRYRSNNRADAATGTFAGADVAGDARIARVEGYPSGYHRPGDMQIPASIASSPNAARVLWQQQQQQHRRRGTAHASGEWDACRRDIQAGPGLQDRGSWDPESVALLSSLQAFRFGLQSLEQHRRRSNVTLNRNPAHPIDGWHVSRLRSAPHGWDSPYPNL